jgi:hypothetical protein
MKELTREQKKIIYIALIVVSFLFLLRIFVYAPQQSKLASIKKQLKDAEAQIAEINRLTAGKELSTAMQDLSAQLQKASSRLLVKDEDLINGLSAQAKKLKIKIKNLDPEDKITLANRVPGYVAQELPISMNLSCDFKALGEYLGILRNDLPALIRIKQLDITGSAEGQANLNITLKISAYLLKGL